MAPKLLVKSRREAQAIADGLNRSKPGVGDWYMSGYMRRRMTETQAVKELQK